MPGGARQNFAHRHGACENGPLFRQFHRPKGEDCYLPTFSCLFDRWLREPAGTGTPSASSWSSSALPPSHSASSGFSMECLPAKPPIAPPSRAWATRLFMIRASSLRHFRGPHPIPAQVKFDEPIIRAEAITPKTEHLGVPGPYVFVAVFLWECKDLRLYLILGRGRPKGTG